MEGMPEGWILACLEDVCTSPQYGWTTSADKNGTGLRLLRTTDISKGTVDWSTVPCCRKIPDDPGKYLLSPGDIVVSRAGSVGLSYIVKECPRSIFASYLIRFRAVPPINSQFIGLFLKTPQYWRAIADETAGIAIPNVNASKLKRLEMPLPPLAEQKRIVAKVEQLLARVNAARERLAKVPAILKRFRQSILAAACSGRLTADWRENQKDLESGALTLERILRKRREIWELNQLKMLTKDKIPVDDRWKERYRSPQPASSDELPELPGSWVWASVEAISTKVVDGVHKKPNYVNRGVPFITVRNLTAGPVISFDNTKYITNKDHQKLIGRANPEKGDILITKDGTLGVTRAVRTDRPFSIFVSVILVKPIDVDMTDYLEIAFSSPQVQEQMVGTGSGLQHIHLRDLRTDCIPLPPLDEQYEIVRRVESLFKLADAIDNRVAVATAHAEKLTQSILAKAFRGELVPTEAELARLEDRPYESASTLLAKIEAQMKDVRPRRKRGRSRQQRDKQSL